MAFDQSKSQLPLAALLRCAADHELTPQQQQALRAHLQAHPEDQDRIEFEHRLRKACSMSFASTPEGSARCPNALRNRIALLAGQADTAPGHASALPDTVHIRTRSASFWSSTGRFLAVAAALVLAVTLAFQVGRQSATGLSQDGSQLLLATRATEYVRREHSRCVKFRDGEAEDKFTATDAASLPGAFQTVMGRTVSLEDLIARADSVRFVDAGRCGVPGGRSLHIRLSSLAEGQEHRASLFVQEDTGKLLLSEGQSYLFADGEEGERPAVYVWRRAGLLYWLVCDRSDSTKMIQALGAPQVRSGQI